MEHLSQHGASPEKQPVSNQIPRFEPQRFKAVAIGSSTGGPGIVEQILSLLPADLQVPIFLAQHMPPSFTASFAVQLDRCTALTVIHAEDAMPVFPGVVYVGVGHQHFRVKRYMGGQVRIEISPEPKDLLYKPSVDELFKSCARVYGSQILGIVLSGIGRDGTAGAQEIITAGGMVLTQSALTCAVYGMPRSCTEAGFAHAQLDPTQISRAILQLSPQHHHEALV